MQHNPASRDDIAAALQLIAKTYGQKQSDGSYHFQSNKGYLYIANQTDSTLINLSDNLPVFHNGQMTQAASPADTQYLHGLPAKAVVLGQLQQQRQSNQIKALQGPQHVPRATLN